MKAAWLTFARIPLRYTAVALFCLLVAVLLTAGLDGANAVLPAAGATLAVVILLWLTRRFQRGRRARSATVAATPVAATPVAAAPVAGTPAAIAPARVRSAPMSTPIGPIQTAFGAEPGWRAIFGEGGDSTMSRLVGWAVTLSGDGTSEVVGLIADPADPARIVAAPSVVTPEGHSLTRYGFKES